jgi:hypothetical protein
MQGHNHGVLLRQGVERGVSAHQPAPLGRAIAEREQAIRLPSCSTGSASGSNEKITCYTIEIDYYVYHTDTGVVEYLYTTAYEVCEKVPAAV